MHDHLLQLVQQKTQDMTHLHAHFEEALEQVHTDPDGPMRCAHTLKGTAGNIGATQVQSVAGELERICADQKAHTVALNQVHEKLEPLIFAIQQVLNSMDKEEQSVPINSVQLTEQQIAQKLSQLTALLEDYDTDAIDLVSELLPMYQGTRFFDVFTQLVTLIDDYDFDAASELLSQIKPELRVSEQA